MHAEPERSIKIAAEVFGFSHLAAKEREGPQRTSQHPHPCLITLYLGCDLNGRLDSVRPPVVNFVEATRCINERRQIDAGRT